MPRTILCTIGTSIAGGTPELIRFQKQGSSWDDDSSQLQREIAERLKRFDLTLPGGRIAASAELNSLQRLNLEPHDEVVLLATDTADGRVCAEMLAKTIQDLWPAVRVVVDRIEGLQVRDEKRLRETGLSRLIQVVLRYVDDPQRKHGGGLILNPTGGFKGVVPFLIVIGMLFRVPTVYVFEFAETLIYLPPLPISFDLQLFLRARPAMAALRQRHGGVMNEQEFYRLIPGFQEDERPLFQSLLEKDGNDATLSPLADALARHEEAARCAIWLSPEARQVLNALNGETRGRLERILIRLTNTIWRAAHIHQFHLCELPVFKAFQFRIAARFVGDRAYVCRVHHMSDHRAYENEFETLRLKDFQNFSNFAEWAPPMSEDELDLAEQDELEQLRREVASLPIKLAAEAAAFRTEIRALQDIVRAQQTRIDHLSREIVLHKNSRNTGPKRASHLATNPSPVVAKPDLMEVLSGAIPKSPPSSLKGTVHAGRYVRDDFGPKGGRNLVFEVSVEGGIWLGILNAALVVAPIPMGTTMPVRIAGIVGENLQLGLPKKGLGGGGSSDLPAKST